MNTRNNKVDMVFVCSVTMVVFLLLWIIAMWALWQFDLPHLWGFGGKIPEESMLDHCLSWPKLMFNSMSTTPAVPGWWAIDAAGWRVYYAGLRAHGVIPWGRDFLSAEFAAVLSIIFFYNLYRSQKSQDKKIHVEGKRLVNTAAARRAGRNEEKRSEKIIELAPGVSCTLDRIRRSVLILGSIGGGKTQTIWYLLAQLIGAKFKLLIVDGPKGDFTVSIPGKPLIISPWHRGPAWDIAKDCPTRGHARELARRLIPSNDKDPLWSNAAQAIFVAVVCKLISTKPRQWGWHDLYEQLNKSPAELKQTATDYYPPAIQLIADVESKTTSSILINLSAFTADVFELAEAWRHTEKRFSFSEWWADEAHPQQVVILQGSAEFESLASGYISSVISLLAGLTASSSFPQSKTRKNLIIADEFAQLPRMDSFPKFLEIGRSKGCSAIIATQSPAQLVKKWGKDTLQSWMAMVGTKIFSRTHGADDQAFVMREIGERKILRKRESISAPQGGGKTTITTAWEEVPDSVVNGDLLEKELGPTREGVRVLISGLSNPFVAILPYFEEKRYRAEFIPNPDFNSTEPNPGSAPHIGVERDADEVSSEQISRGRDDDAISDHFVSEKSTPSQRDAPFPHRKTHTAIEASKVEVADEELSQQKPLAEDDAERNALPAASINNVGEIDVFLTLASHAAATTITEDDAEKILDEDGVPDSTEPSVKLSIDDETLDAALRLLGSDDEPTNVSKAPKPK